LQKVSWLSRTTFVTKPVDMELVCHVLQKWLKK